MVGTRESPCLYTRCPKPMTFFFSASAWSIHSLARFSASSAVSSLRIPSSSKVCITASLAPPCSGPLRAPIAPVTAECRSDSVEVITRAVKVDALKECSAYRMIDTRNASTTSGAASSPKAIHRKFCA